MKLFSPLLTHVDHIDALTHPEDRAYMINQLLKEGIDPFDSVSLMKRAVHLAELELVKPGNKLSVSRIGRIVTQQQRLINNYAAVIAG